MACYHAKLAPKTSETGMLDPKLVKERNDLWVTLFKVLESLRDDYLPGEPFYQAFTKILIMHIMFQPFIRSGRGSSVSDLSRRSGIPRQTVARKLEELTQQGIAEQRGRLYVPIPSYFNGPGSTLKLERRRVMLRQSLGEPCTTCPASKLQQGSKKNHQNVQF
jgi:hypothetical protein